MMAQGIPPSQSGMGFPQGALLHAQPKPGHVCLPPINRRISMTKHKEKQWLLTLVFSSGKTCALLPRLGPDSTSGRRSPFPLCASSQALAGPPPSQALSQEAGGNGGRTPGPCPGLPGPSQCLSKSTFSCCQGRGLSRAWKPSQRPPGCHLSPLVKEGVTLGPGVQPQVWGAPGRSGPT